ncbi:DUF2207 domain-containing protein [Naasia sp. SYSU D00948]|uniref:DUF2207 domain-containing protein n=1 Tax=Naasia sp. SYSU D00948 TaxID=2817379 RepID=UPI001B303C16|nr:DUF2207 domain-containing protein [Naasia sp. SYSU D00948]
MRSPVAALSGVLALLLAVLGAAAPVAADVDDFEFSSFEADYTLGRDEEGRSTLHTVERLTAEFPETDQNRGIRRALVDEYQGAPTDLRVLSVTDGDGAPLEWESEEEDEFLLVTIASDDYVHGSHTYVITYEQRNVTLTGGDGEPDEFYWDVNGTGWAQPFGRVTGRLHLDAGLASALTGDAACYTGAEGSDERCPITTERSGGETVLVAEDTHLGPGENVTLAVGFAAGTFVPRDDSLFASPFGAILLLSIALLLATVAGALVFRVSRLRDARGRPVIVPEYLPLPAPDLLVSAVLLHRTRRAVAASLVSLAVRGVVRIVEEEGSRGKPSFTVQFAGMEGRPRLGSGPKEPSATERKLIRAFFGKPKPRERVRLDPRNTRLGKAVHDVLRGVRQDAVDQGYQRLPASGPRTLLGVLAVLGMVATLVSAFVLIAAALGGIVPVLALLLAPVGILALVLPAHRPLTKRGAEVRDALLGIRDYLRLAEAERMRMLQSPEGALRVEGSDGSVLHLYEQLLPHAVLFGVEKDWAEVLGTWYEREGSEPEWFAGPAGFHAGAFSSGISSLSASASTTYSGSSSSSSSGGSSGGGFSGGGGGGGGGGGV